MKRWLYILHFFAIVSPLPALMIWAFAVVTIAGCGLVVVRPMRAAAVMTPVIVLQAFAAASGFTVSARRGYFDLLLTRGESRLVLGLAHWLLSMAPGVLSWMVLATVGWITRRDLAHELFAPGTIVALLLVSAHAWWMNVRLPRFSSAIGWLVVVSLGGMVADVGWPSPLLTWLYPIRLVGADLDGRAVDVMPAAMSAFTGMCLALLMLDRVDIPLEASQ